jgi:hypothetical protein
MEHCHKVFADNLEATCLAEHIGVHGGPVSVGPGIELGLDLVAVDAGSARQGQDLLCRWCALAMSWLRSGVLGREGESRCA